MYSDADEPQSVQFSQYLFFRRMQDMMNETVRGIGKPIYELKMLLHVRSQGIQYRNCV